MKRMVINVFYLIFLIVVLLPFSFAAVGVRPSSYEIDFEPGLKRVFTFNFMSDRDVDFELYSEGPFSEYVTLSKNHLTGGGSVNALLELPLEAEEPGRQNLLIGARQTSGARGMVGIVGNVRGIIFINVPYPGKYAELDFKTSNANLGEDVEFELIIYSRGDEDINVNSRIEIYDMNGNFKERINLGNHLIESAKSIKLDAKLNTQNYVAGDYNAIAVVDYGDDVSREEEIFRLGRLFVDVVNHTRVFERGKINRFEVIAESFWNDPIENVYANISILGYPELGFYTPSILINPWDRRTLTGFFDTSEIKEDNFQTTIKLHYDNRTTEKTVNLELEKEISNVTYLISGLVILIIFAGSILFYIQNKKKKFKNEKEKKD